MKKRNVTIAIIITVFVLSFNLGYSKNVSSAEQIVIKYADPSKPGTSRTRAAEETMLEIEKRTGGRVKHEFYWSQSLLKAKDIMKGLNNHQLKQVGLIQRTESPA